METLEDRDKAQLLQQMRRQAEIRPEQDISESTASSATGTFRIRLALAGVLLLSVILLDQEGKCFAGISMEQILDYITGVDYAASLKTWVETAVSGSQALL